ncbi:hypothetical protein B0A52_00722 [Exophiala mesophila]|uniref:Cytochrome c oxidase polypeptide VIIA n=1 Tax=Exophiala mesophila TaxID=212818 RepID=A0A438NI07_EXOME|nr:hypothetical protein B0A52_00722 [Exophiala mesophila]
MLLLAPRASTCTFLTVKAQVIGRQAFPLNLIFLSLRGLQQLFLTRDRPLLVSIEAQIRSELTLEAAGTYNPFETGNPELLRSYVFTMPIKPIEGMLRRGLVLDLSIAGGLGTTFGYLFWYGYHLPRVRARDTYYAKLEDERAREAGIK